MATPVKYGSFNLNDGINYFVVGRNTPSFTPIKQTYYKIGRLEGMKKTGEVVNEKSISLDMVIIGASRSDLETKIDTLQQALYLRGQNLVTRTNDNRYYIADCVDCQIKFSKENVLYCTASVLFVATSPWAYASVNSTNDSGALSLTVSSGAIYKFPTLSLVGGGNVFSRPVIRVYKSDAYSIWSQIQVTQNTDSQTLTITSNLPTTNGGYVDIYCDPAGVNGFSVILNGTMTQSTFSGIFPIIEPTATSIDMYVTATGVVNTNSSAATLASATSITVASNAGLTGTGTIALSVDTGANNEVVTFNLPATGAGPYTLTAATGQTLTKAHASGVAITNVPPVARAVYTWTPRWLS